MRTPNDKKRVNYSPPEWLVLHHELTLEPELAKRFQAVRQRLCDNAGDDHQERLDLRCNSLLNDAVKLLVEFYAIEEHR